MAKGLCQLLLAVLCVLSMGLPLPQASGSLSAAMGLELEPLGTARHRTRRQVFPGNGMPCLTVTFLTELKDRFKDRIDPNDDGKATVDEVRQYLRNYNPEVTDAQVNQFIRRRDLNGNGIIDLIPEYILDVATPDLTSEAASEWFGLEDSDGDGYVTREELMNIAQRLGMSHEQADSSVAGYYMAVDTDKDNKLSFDEYKVLYEK